MHPHVELAVVATPARSVPGVVEQCGMDYETINVPGLNPTLPERLKILKKENLYVALINTMLGMGVVSLLKGSMLAYTLAVILVGTIIFIERTWLYENIFKRKKWYAVAGYSALVSLMLVFLFFITASSRNTSLIVKGVNGFLHDVTVADYRSAYEKLSEVSKKTYSEEDFVNDHKQNRVKFHNFIIHEVIFNKYDKHQAVAMVSSPFLLYGRETLNLEMILEGGGWRIDFSRSIVNPNAPASVRPKRKSGIITNFFNKLF